MKTLKCLVVFAVVAGLCTTALAVAPPEGSMRAVAVDQVEDHQSPPLEPPVYFSDACPADDWGELPSLTAPYSIWPVFTCASANDYENDGYDCNYGANGMDEIFQFTVDQRGMWQFDTFNICASFDTSLMVREETGGGCPGDFKDCDGDSGHPYCGWYQSAVQTWLSTGVTYYLVVDGWSTWTCGTANVVAMLVIPECNTQVDPDAFCEDLDGNNYCNGQSVCNMITGMCEDGPDPCPVYQICDEDTDTCNDPDPCLAWKGGLMGRSFFPYVNFSPNAWVADDIELERACAGDPALLDYYMFNNYGRAIQNPVGTPYFYDMSLWTVETLTCLPEALVPDTYCQVQGTIQPGGSPPDVMTCDPAGEPPLPDNSGDFDRCEIDFFMGYVGSDLGAGFGIAGDEADPTSEQIVGGPAADDDYGESVFFLEDAPGAGTWGAWGFTGPIVPDFGEAEVCIYNNLGVCCVYYDDGSNTCLYVNEEDCTAAAGDPGVSGTVYEPCQFWVPNACEDPDGDGWYTNCADNCPGVANPGQEDCDAGVTPEGDACETDPYYADDDADGACNCNPDPAEDGGDCDDCDQDANKTAPGICGCGVSDVDTDGDGTADCNDLCPFDPNKVVPGQCGCGVPDTDTDGDGVADCNDKCPGVDDAVFAPDCQGAIPTVSEWGLVILALLLLVGAKLYFGRRAAVS
jgi:hypothetical protein